MPKHIGLLEMKEIFELPRDKTNKMTVRPAKTQISLGIRPVWSESSLSAWRNLGSSSTHWVHSEDPDQTGRMSSWLGSSLSAWRNLGSLATHWVHSEDSDQTGWMSRWLGSSLSAWRNHGSLSTHWVHSEDSDQTGRMSRLIRVFTVRMKKP